jgi:hypothetical protein
VGRLSTILLLATSIALIGCGSHAAPEEVALEFWQAALDHDFDDAEPLSTASDERQISEFLGSFEPHELPAIGEALQSQDRALVETTFLTHADRPPIVFHTTLVSERGRWRVDLETTGQELRRARIELGVDRAKDSLAEVAASSGNEASAQAAAGELRRAADEIESAVEHPAQQN